MTQSFARRSLCQNSLFDNKDKLAGGNPTKGSNHCTFAPVATRAPTPAVISVITPFVASGSADSSVVGYSEDDL